MSNEKIVVEFSKDEIDKIMDYPSICSGKDIHDRIASMLGELVCIRMRTTTELMGTFTKEEAELMCNVFENFFEDNIMLLPKLNFYKNADKLFTPSMCNQHKVDKSILMNKINTLTEVQTYTLLTYIMDYHNNKDVKSVEDIFFHY